MNSWCLLITTLPTANATIRQRAWRTLKSSGAAVLRDGVYLMPDQAPNCTLFEGLAANVRDSGGTATVLRVEQPEHADFASLFDRGDHYAALLGDVARARADLDIATVQATHRYARRLRKKFAATTAIDFFPGVAQQLADDALRDLESAVARVMFPDEPHDVAGEIALCAIADYQQRVWATRERPWVDRLASAWLIRRFVDPRACIVWIKSPADCPPDALGFDFDGAAFSHVGNRVTFEVLSASFGLTQPALARLGQLVHYLDVGGIQVPEAAGVERVLGGLRDAIASDDEFMAKADSVFDGLFAAFGKQGAEE